MPHLSPMAWSLAILSFWLLLSMMMSMFWWSSSNSFTTLNNNNQAYQYSAWLWHLQDGRNNKQ